MSEVTTPKGRTQFVWVNDKPAMNLNARWRPFHSYSSVFAASIQASIGLWFFSGRRKAMNVKIRRAAPDCGHLFDPDLRVKNQRYYGEKDCYRARKLKYQKEKLATDPD
jgi:hypothetical protein